MNHTNRELSSPLQLLLRPIANVSMHRQSVFVRNQCCLFIQPICWYWWHTVECMLMFSCGCIDSVRLPVCAFCVHVQESINGASYLLCSGIARIKLMEGLKGETVVHGWSVYARRSNQSLGRFAINPGNDIKTLRSFQTFTRTTHTLKFNLHPIG